MGAVLSAALLLETVGWIDEARAIEAAVEAALAAGQTTTDVGGRAGTREVGEWIAAHLRAAAG
jgi:isocitrate/isopropylmalate dehydrogenase